MVLAVDLLFCDFIKIGYDKITQYLYVFVFFFLKRKERQKNGGNKV